jgi:hypothetical protein
MTDALVIVAILLGNSLLNIVTWAFIIGKLGSETKSVFDKVQDTIKVIKGE